MLLFAIISAVTGAVVKGFVALFHLAGHLASKKILLPVLLIIIAFFIVLALTLPLVGNVLSDRNVGIFTTVVGVGIVFVILNGLNKSHLKKLKDDWEKQYPDNLKTDEKQGVVFGRMKKQWENTNNPTDQKYITKPESLEGHILVVGTPGSGKSSCIAIPTLRAYSERIFAIDIKGELYEKTKDYRQEVKVFNPLDDNSYGYDPYFCLYSSDNPAQEAKAIAQAIIPLPHGTHEPFWIESAQNLLTGAILHYSEQEFSFLETMEAVQSTPAKDLVDLLCKSKEAQYYANAMSGMEDKTLSSIMGEMSKNIVPFVTDKNLISALSRMKNITPNDLEDGSDVYISIPEHLLRQWKNLLTLIVNQFLTHFEKRAEMTAQPILFLLDEFPRLGKISTVMDGLGTLRSKNISICLLIQSLKQLDVIYGQNERDVIVGNCSYKAVLNATDTETQKYFSELAGMYVKQAKSVTEPSPFKPRIESTNPQREPNIPPADFGMLDDMVLFSPFPVEVRHADEQENAQGQIDPKPYCRVEKVPYYAEVEVAEKPSDEVVGVIEELPPVTPPQPEPPTPEPVVAVPENIPPQVETIPPVPVVEIPPDPPEPTPPQAEPRPITSNIPPEILANLNLQLQARMANRDPSKSKLLM